MELAAPRLMIAERRVGGPGPAVSLVRSGSNSGISVRAVEAEKADAVMAPTARETRPVEQRGSGADELIHRHRRCGRGIAEHPDGSRSHEHYGVAHRRVQGVEL